jgi:hypothetical protein
MTFAPSCRFVDRRRPALAASLLRRGEIRKAPARPKVFTLREMRPFHDIATTAPMTGSIAGRFGLDHERMHARGKFGAQQIVHHTMPGKSALALKDGRESGF